MAPRRNFDQAFRAKVVAKAIKDGNWCKAAREHGIHESTVVVGHKNIRNIVMYFSKNR